MKKSVSGILLLAFVLLLSAGCGKKNIALTEEAYNYGKEAIQICNDFLQDDLTAAEADSKMLALKDKAGKLDGIEYPVDGIVRQSIEGMETDLQMAQSKDTDSDITKAGLEYIRDNLDKQISYYINHNDKTGLL
jgi:hypothetical protein